MGIVAAQTPAGGTGVKRSVDSVSSERPAGLLVEPGLLMPAAVVGDLVQHEALHVRIVGEAIDTPAHGRARALSLRRSTAGTERWSRAGAGRSVQHVRIHHVDGLADGIGEDLVEDGGEHLLEPVALDITQVRHAHTVVEGEQGMLAAQDGLLLEDVHSGEARPPRAQGGLQRARGNETGAARVHHHRRGLHEGEIGSGDHPTRLGHETHVERDHVRAREKGVAVPGEGLPIGARLLHGGRASPDDDVHAEGLAVARHHRADLAVAVDAEALAAEPGADGIGLPASGAQRGHLLRDAPQRRDNEPHVSSAVAYDGRPGIWLEDRMMPRRVQASTSMWGTTPTWLMSRSLSRRSRSGARSGVRSRSSVTASTSFKRSARTSGSLVWSFQIVTWWPAIFV